MLPNTTILTYEPNDIWMMIIFYAHLLNDYFQIAIWMLSVVMFCILNMTLSQFLAFYKNFWTFTAAKLLEIESNHHDVYWPAW